MISGIISIVIGVIWYMRFFTSIAERDLMSIIDVSVALNGSIFIVGGLILLKMNSINKNIASSDWSNKKDWSNKNNGEVFLNKPLWKK